jgi:hypothetical protein
LKGIGQHAPQAAGRNQTKKGYALNLAIRLRCGVDGECGVFGATQAKIGLDATPAHWLRIMAKKRHTLEFSTNYCAATGEVSRLATSDRVAARLL